MTLDEAIKVCEDNATKIGGNPQSDYHAACYKQVAEWLTELKQWRRVYGICPSYEMCIPECREGYNAQIAEYKRLLRIAVDDITHRDYCHRCKYENVTGKEQYLNCKYHRCYKWRYADEALKLVGGSENG